MRGTEIETVYLQVGERVRKARQRHGWSQEKLAGKVGMTRSVVANLETGRCRLLLHDVLALAHALNLRPTSLMK